ncbi:MAG: hypothetical protein GXY03_00975 [Solirubrobacterales bacterium]|nr:hypothetical protein [Solirubrobacterales bacterium]
MPITDSTAGTLDRPAGWFFDGRCDPGARDRLTAALTAWLTSDALRWLVKNVPGRAAPGAPPAPLAWPAALDGALPAEGAALDRPLPAEDTGALPAAVAAPEGPLPAGAAGALSAAVAALDEICDWSVPGTVWDFRVAGERPLAGPGGDEPPASRDAVAARTDSLGLRAHGRLSGDVATVVVLGGRRLAPLNRTRVVADAIAAGRLAPERVVMLSARRALDGAERASAEVATYAPGARTEADLMAAAARRLGPGAGGVEVVEVPAPPGTRRASTHETLRFLAEDSGLDLAAPLALVTSPTCRPYQHLEAARALGLAAGLAFETVAHPRAWAAAPGVTAAAPHVYLQEIRGTIQAAGRYAAELAATAPAEPPGLAALA